MKSISIIFFVLFVGIATAQNVKRYEGKMMLPSDLDQLKGVVNRHTVSGEGYYDYYENSDEERVKHGAFYLNARGYDINGTYSHGKKVGQWTFAHPVENTYIKTYYNKMTITFRDDVLCGPCEYITRAPGGMPAKVTVLCNFNNGIITGDASVLYEFDDSSATIECRGMIDEDGLLHGVWVVSDKGGIEITQKSTYYKGALIFEEELDLSTGEKTIGYSAFENLKKAPEIDQVRDTIIYDQNCIVYNGMIAAKLRGFEYYNAPSRVRLGALSILSIFPDSMEFSDSLMQQKESWWYSYSDKALKK